VAAARNSPDSTLTSYELCSLLRLQDCEASPTLNKANNLPLQIHGLVGQSRYISLSPLNALSSQDASILAREPLRSPPKANKDDTIRLTTRQDPQRRKESPLTAYLPTVKALSQVLPTTPSLTPSAAQGTRYCTGCLLCSLAMLP
jgi:hypothetical protein